MSAYPGAALHAERRRRDPALPARASTPVDAERQPLLPQPHRHYDGSAGHLHQSPLTSCPKYLWYYVAAFATLVLFLLLLSMDALTPTEFGLVYNRVTGVVYKNDPYTHGRYLIGPTNVFLKFPANFRYLEFSANPKADHAPIQARTGRDVDDPDSGGQPIGISLAFTYQMNKTLLGKVYENFAMDYEKRLIQFTMQTISDSTQKFHPSAFWNERSKVATEMRQHLDEVLSDQGFVRVRTLQLLRLEFLPAYEQTIVGIQLAIQQRTTNEYKQQVVGVLKDIDIMESETTAKIATINAKAEAVAMLNLNGAAAISFNVTQNAKAIAFSKLAKGLGIDADNAALLKYIRVRNVRQHSSSNMTIAFEHPIARLRNPSAATATASTGASASPVPPATATGL